MSEKHFDLECPVYMISGAALPKINDTYEMIGALTLDITTELQGPIKALAVFTKPDRASTFIKDAKLPPTTRAFTVRDEPTLRSHLAQISSETEYVVFDPHPTNASPSICRVSTLMGSLSE